MRIDLWLVENGFAPSRQKAQELIAAGRVILCKTTGEKTVVSKPSQVVSLTEARVEVLPSEGPQFVSRGGQKLFAALARTGIRLEGKRVLDVGISTGGFTDCCLQAGAKEVVGIDVGHGQLAQSLRTDSRVTVLEGVNARDLGEAALSLQQFDLIVVDVSFISLKLILPGLCKYLAPAGEILALVKPQFEVGRSGLGKNGIVKDTTLFGEVEKSIRDVCASVGLAVNSYFECALRGSDGNQEFFIYAQTKS